MGSSATDSQTHSPKLGKSGSAPRRSRAACPSTAATSPPAGTSPAKPQCAHAADRSAELLTRPRSSKRSGRLASYAKTERATACREGAV